MRRVQPDLVSVRHMQHDELHGHEEREEYHPRIGAPQMAQPTSRNMTKRKTLLAQTGPPGPFGQYDHKLKASQTSIKIQKQRPSVMSGHPD